MICLLYTSYYTVDYDGNPMLTRSSLGLKASHADFTKNIALKKVKTQNNVAVSYTHLDVYKRQTLGYLY